MKRILVLILALLLSVAICPAQSQCLPLRDNSMLPFKGGEKLSFRIHFKLGAINSDVATATMSVTTTKRGGVDIYNARIFAQTAKFYDKFFKVREDFRSSFRGDNLKPVTFWRDTREGRYFCTNDYKFVWNTYSPYVLAEIETSHNPKYSKHIPLTSCTSDPITLFYTARNIDMDKVKVGEKYPVTFAVADDTYSICFVYKGKDTINLKNFGKIKTHKFSVQVVEGDVFTGDSDMYLWFSDDANMVPVYFEAPLKIGLVCGRLVGAENLKAPLKTE